MRRIVALLLMAPAAGWAQPQTNGINAASVYQPALSNLAAWSSAHTNFGSYPASNAAAPEAAHAYAELQPLLRGLAPAAAATYCDWGTRFEDGPGALLPYLAPARRGARAALWAADYALSNNLPGFVDAALEAARLSRNVGEDQLLLSYLVQIAAEKPALDLLARNLERLDDRQLDRLAAELEKLPPGATLMDAARMEKAMFVDHQLGRMQQAMREADTNLFEVIPDGPAAGAADVAASSLARELRLSSVVESGPRLWIGFETPQGESFTIARGRPNRGIELLSADVARGEALIARGQETALVKLQSREIAPVRLRFRAATGQRRGIFDDLLQALGTDMPPAAIQELSTPEGFLAALQKTSEEYDEWISALQRLPLEQFRPWQEDFLARSTGLTRLLLPVMDKAIEKERALLEARARLAAALAARRARPLR